MVRKGWSTVEVPNRWLQIIRGPKPPSASIAVLGDEDLEEVELLKKALEKAEKQAKTPPLETQIAHAVQFIERAKKRVAGSDEKIRKAVEALRQAEAEKVADIQAIADAEGQVERLRVQSAQPVAQPTVVRGQDMEAEVTRLRAQFVQFASAGTECSRETECRGQQWESHSNHEDLLADWLVAMNGGDRSRVQELTTMISTGFDRLTELMGCWRIVTRYGMRGQRISEAKNPGLSSRRRRTQRLRALQRSMDSDSESDAESAQGWSPLGVEVVASQCANGGECAVRQGSVGHTSFTFAKTSHCRHPEGHSW